VGQEVGEAVAGTVFYLEKEMRMPVDRMQRTIAGMMPGETMWATPWAVLVMEDETCMINGCYSAHQESGGTVDMQVHRNAKGFEIDLRGSDYAFSKGANHFGSSPNDYLPVTKIVT